VQRELEGQDVRLVAVVPGTQEQARRLRDARLLRWLLLCDPTWETHRRLGLRRASVRETWLALAVWRSYLRLALRGRRPRRPEQDVRWLPQPPPGRLRSAGRDRRRRPHRRHPLAVTAAAGSARACRS
jgi:hypothetical protein